MFAAVFAQLSTSVTDDQIRLVIIALIVVAALLGATTIWYFLHTSPRRRAAAAAELAARSRQGGAVRPERSVGSPAVPDGEASSASSAPSPTAYPGTGEVEPARHDAIGDSSIDDDEWMRLTAPQPPNTGSTTDS